MLKMGLPILTTACPNADAKSVKQYITRAEQGSQYLLPQRHARQIIPGALYQLALKVM